MGSAARKPRGAPHEATRGAVVNRTRKRVRRANNHRRSKIIITSVLLLLICVLGFQSISLRERNDFLRQQEEEIMQQIRLEEQRALEIEDFESFVGTDDYVRGVAEEILGLAEPGVIIFQSVE